MKRQWFRIENRADDPSVADLYVYDDIGQSWYGDDAVTAQSFLNELKTVRSSVTTIVVHINCLGGDVFEAVAIANALRQESKQGRTIETLVEGIAASAATIVMMAGSVITVNDNALVMIHNPWSIEIGDAAQMRKSADALDKIRDTIIATYQWHSTQDAAALAALMDAETWMTADEAIANGFATAKVEGLKAAASISRKALDRVKHIPEQYRNRVEDVLKPAPAKPTPAAALDVVNACDAADCRELTASFLAANLTMDQVTAKISDAATAKTAAKTAIATAAATAKARATTITALCDQAKQPKLAAGYIAGGMTPDQVKDHLIIVKASQDAVEIDSKINPSASAGGAAAPKKHLTSREIFAAREAAATKAKA